MVLPNGQFRLVYIPKDFQAAAAFYRDGLSLPVDHEWDYGGGDQGVVFIAGSGMIELLGQAPGSAYVEPRGISALIQVEDADRWYQMALARSLKVVQEPTSYPWGHRVVRLADPDGLVLSFFSQIEG